MRTHGRVALVVSARAQHSRHWGLRGFSFTPHDVYLTSPRTSSSHCCSCSCITTAQQKANAAAVPFTPEHKSPTPKCVCRRRFRSFDQLPGREIELVCGNTEHQRASARYFSKCGKQTKQVTDTIAGEASSYLGSQAAKVVNWSLLINASSAATFKELRDVSNTLRDEMRKRSYKTCRVRAM